MSYPFGFSSDFKGFHFRSVYLPILCIVLAVYMASGVPRNLTEAWSVAAVAVLYSSIPLFFNFDYSEILVRSSYWGLVDNFQAGIAAMAAAAVVKSLKARSLFWLALGALISSFTLLIKPSGLMVMALLIAVWLFVVIVEWLREGKQPHSNLRRYVILGGIQAFLIYAVVALFCFFSEYFSAQNFTYAKYALKIMNEVLKVTPSRIFVLLFDSTGIAFVIWVAGVGLLMMHHCFSNSDKQPHVPTAIAALMISTPFIWCLGAGYWLVVQSGGSQVRYFHPFFLMGAVCMIPMALHLLQHSHRWIRLAELLLCILPALNIGVMLAHASPSIPWQRLSGVNVTVGKDQPEVKQAYTFLEELRRRNKSANLYYFYSGVLPDIFTTVGAYEEIVRPDIPFFKTVSNVDWKGGFVVKQDQLLKADYVLVRNDLNGLSEKIYGQPIDTPDLESIVFQQWLCGLNEDAGVKTLSDGRVLRLIEIVDRKLFEREIELFLSANSWRSEFIAANSPRRWWNEADVSGYATNLAARDFDFMGIYTLHALLVRRVDTGIKVECWWEEMRHEDANSQRMMFFHLVDQTGKIYQDRALPLDMYSPPFDSRRWRYGTVTFDQPLSNEATLLAFGIYRPESDFLKPDKGVRDWGGIRVLVPISENTR